jgi:hypothetical protein
MYCIYICTVYTYVLNIRMYCIYICTVYTYVLYIHMYCIYTCTVYTYVLYVHMYSIYVCTVYTYVLYIRMYCIYICTVYTYVLYIHMYCIYVCIYVYTFVYTYISSSLTAFECPEHFNVLIYAFVYWLVFYKFRRKVKGRRYHYRISHGPGSSVGIANELRDGRSGDRTQLGARFSAPVQTGPGAHSALCTMGTGSFPGVKSRPSVTLSPHPLLVPLVMKE